MRTARVRGPGHPDHACDLVASSILEEYMRRDSASRLDVHVSGGRGALFVAGQVISSADFDVSAVVRRTLGGLGSTGSIEPFIAFEPFSPHAAPVFGARDMVQVSGYATNETLAFLPQPVVCAREIATELERCRINDPHWFWLGADYEVSVYEEGKTLLVMIRAEHSEGQTLLDVRNTLTRLVKERFPHADVRVNPGGEEMLGGLAGQMGASDHGTNADLYGSQLPCSPVRSGLHPLHPSVIGSWLSRQVACELVAAKKGKAIMVQALWMPFETRAHLFRVRNERGENLSHLVDAQRFDINRAPPSFLVPQLLIDRLRVGYDNTIRLPWENGMV